MRKIKLMLCMAAASLAMNAQNAQRVCGTMDVLDRMKTDDPALALTMQQIENQTATYINQHKNNAVNNVITIPVVFHVVYSASAQNISDAQCIAQLDQLNKDYARLNSDASSTPSAFSGVAANTGIQFCMAQRDPSGAATTGIERRSTTTSSFSDNDNVKFYSSGGLNAWSSSSYLNIWSCNLGGGLLGYAQFPGGSASTDGVVLLYSSIGSMTSPGTASPYNLGRTATHEVGHWLNLYHIWGDDGTSCSGSDNVSDTPNQADETYGCPSFPQVSCSNGPNGDMFMNYMDYTDDNCMNMFTSGQSSRMNALFGTGGARVALLSSLGCTPPTGGTTCGTVSGLSAGSITASSATLSWAAISGATSYNVQYRVNGGSTWTTASTTSTSYALSGLVASTTYQYQIQAVCASGSGSYSAVSSFTTSASGGGGCTDNYESNNTSSTAKTIVTNTALTGLIGTSTDKDWYKFTTTSPNTKVKITLTTLPFDYDVKLYNSSLTTLGTGQNGGTTSEQIIYNTTTARTYYVQVYGYNSAYSATSCYTLTASVSSSNFREGANEFELTPVSGVEDFIVYPNPATKDATVLVNLEKASELSVRIIDVAGKIILNSNVQAKEGSNTLPLDLSNIKSGLYFVQLTSDGAQSVKRLVIE